MSRFLPPSARIDRCANSYSLCLGRTLVLSCVLLSAVDADAKGVKDLRVVIPDCVGQASWGGSIIARSMRRVMSPEVSQVIGHDEFRKTLKGLSTTQEALKGRNLLVWAFTLKQNSLEALSNAIKILE